jgi:hypothetical protein
MYTNNNENDNNNDNIKRFFIKDLNKSNDNNIVEELTKIDTINEKKISNSGSNESYLCAAIS